MGRHKQAEPGVEGSDLTRTSRGLLLLMLVPVLVLVCGVGPARADGELVPQGSTISLGEAGSPQLLLRGGSPRSHIVLELPHRWQQVSLDLRLRWQASPLLRDRSSLTVEVNGVPQTATRLAPGSGEIAVRTPPIAVPDHRLTIDVAAHLETIDDECPPPDAPGAYVNLDPTSTIQLTSNRPQAFPDLADLPEALVERVGDRVPPLFIRFPDAPTPSGLRAAMLIHQAVSRASGFPGVPVRIVYGDGPVPAALWVSIRHAVGPEPPGRVRVLPVGPGAEVEVSGDSTSMVQAA